MENENLMIVETTKNSNNKFEYNEFKKKIILDRTLSGSMYYPEEYGYLEKTLDYDGDALDVICITEKSTFPGCLIPIRIIGILKMKDNDEIDDKIIAVNAVEPRLEHIKSLEDISEAKKNEITNFFSNYKKLEKKNSIIIKGFEGKEEALKTINLCKKIYNEYKDLINLISKKELIKKISENF